MTGPQPPAGWYPDPQDPSALRWWDGTVWTAHQQPAQPAHPPVADAAPAGPVTTWPSEAAVPAGAQPLYGDATWPPAAEPRRSPKVWVLAGAGAVLILVIGVVAALVSSGSSSKSSTADPAGWVSVVDPTEHFSDRLPAQPTNRTLPPVNIGGLHMTLNLATVQRTAPDGTRLAILIEDAEIAEPLPAETVPSNLREAIFSIAGAAGFDLVSQSSTTFQGHQAWQGEFKTKNGSLYQALAIMNSPTRMYIIAGPKADFDPIAARFRALP